MKKTEHSLFGFVNVISKAEGRINDLRAIERSQSPRTIRSLFLGVWKNRFSYCHCRFTPSDYFDPRPSASAERAYIHAYRYEHHVLIRERAGSTLPQRFVLFTRPRVNFFPFNLNPCFNRFLIRYTRLQRINRGYIQRWKKNIL